MAYSLVRLDASLVSDVENEWSAQLSVYEHVNPSRCLGAIARARDIVETTGNNQYAYALKQDDEFVAITLLSHACPKGPKPWLKLLEVTVSPKLVDKNEGEPDEAELVRMGAYIVSQVYALTDDMLKSESMKVYGDSIMDIRIWKEIVLAPELQSADLPFVPSSHGQWLVLTKK